MAEPDVSDVVARCPAPWCRTSITRYDLDDGHAQQCDKCCSDAYCASCWQASGSTNPDTDEWTCPKCMPVVKAAAPRKKRTKAAEPAPAPPKVHTSNREIGITSWREAATAAQCPRCSVDMEENVCKGMWVCQCCCRDAQPQLLCKTHADRKARKRAAATAGPGKRAKPAK
jgi:hypothetical protein